MSPKGRRVGISIGRTHEVTTPTPLAWEVWPRAVEIPFILRVFTGYKMLSKKRVAPNPSVVNRDEWATGADEFAKLGALVKSSRGKLRALANAQTFNEMASAVTDLGDIDAAHIVLLVAKVDIDGDGRVSGAEYSRFMEEASEVISSVQSSVLNTSIVAALLLTIILPLLLAPFDPMSEPEDFEASFFAHAAAVFSGDDGFEAAERGRRGFYVAECVILGLNTTCCIIGLLVSVSYYGAVSATPGRIAKVGFMLETSGALMFLQAIWFLCVMFLILSVPIVAAKASAVAFVCAVAVSLLSVGISFYIMHKCWRVQLNIFRDEARALMGGAEEEKREENGEEGGAVADSTEKQVEG